MPALHASITELDLDLSEAFQVEDAEALLFAELENRLAACLRDPRSLFSWTHYAARRRQAHLLQLGPIAEGLH